MGQKPPGTPAAGDVEDGVKNFAWRMDPRSAGSFEDREMRFYTSAFGVGEVGVVCLSHAWWGI